MRAKKQKDSKGVLSPRETSSKGGGTMEAAENFPACLKCGKGVLLPLSDYGREGATIMYKAWVCSNPECAFTVRIDNGDVSFTYSNTEDLLGK